MRQNLKITIVLLAGCSLTCLPTLLSAQPARRTSSGPSKPQATGRPAEGRVTQVKATTEAPGRPAGVKRPRPEPEVEPEIDKLDPVLEQILIKWEQQSAKIKTLHGKHLRREFNKTFESEKVCTGEFFLETPDKGRIDMNARPTTGQTSVRKNAEGVPYRLDPAVSERWICTGQEVLSFNLDDKSYTRDEIPPSMRGKNIVHTPLPFLFGMKAEDAKQRFNITLEGTSKDSVKLKALPRMDTDRQNYQEAWIILDTNRYVPTAVRLIDPSGLEVIYMFESIEINDSGFLQKLKLKFRDPYDPSTRGFTLAISNDIQPSGNKTTEGRGPVKTAGGPTEESLPPGTRGTDRGTSPRTNTTPPSSSRNSTSGRKQ